MCLLILGFVLGIIGVIPQSWFDDWNLATLVEFLIEFIAIFIVLLIRSKKRSKIVFKKDNINLQDSEEKLSERKFDTDFDYCELCAHNNDYSLDCYECNSANKFVSKYENPYAKDTLRYYAWNERNGIDV